MDSRRTRVTVPGTGDARQRIFRRVLPVALVGMALTAVAVVGDGGVSRAHYLRQLVFGPAGPETTRPAAHPRHDDTALVVPVIPAGGAARP
jgi:nitrate reductase NapE component